MKLKNCKKCYVKIDLSTSFNNLASKLSNSFNIGEDTDLRAYLWVNN